jgi:hypothetical protein
MNDDRFMERLKEEARSLRFDPQDDAIWTRLAARIRAGLAARPLTPAQLLAAGFRPIAASLTAVALAATIGLAWFERTNEAAAVDSFAASGVEIAMDGDLYSVGD